MLGSLLLSPITGLTFIMREIANAVDEAREADRRAIMAELRELHRRIESGDIAEADFDTQEAALLDRLDAMSGGVAGGA
jgi:Gas vesicle protein G